MSSTLNSTVVPASLTCETVLASFTGIVGIAGKPIVSAEALREAWHNECFGTREVQVDELYGKADVDILNHVLHRFTERCRNDGLGSFDFVEVKNLFHNLYFGPHKFITCIRLLAEMDEADFNFLRSCLEGLLGSAALYDFLICKPDERGVQDGGAARLRTVLVEHPQTVTTLEDPDSSLPNVSSQTIRDALRGHSSIPDGAVDFMMTHLPHISQGSLLDLSDMNLSVRQITRLLSACPHVRHLNISHNAHVVVEDIPELLLTASTILRLNVMGCESLDGDALSRLMREKPSLFRQLEGLMHPALLTIAPKPADFPISFTFVFAHREFNAVAMSLFTPTLILQGLATLLPTVWKEHDISYQLLVQPQDLLRGRSLADSLTVAGSSSISSGMMGYVAFTSGTYTTNPSRSGIYANSEWYCRPVVSVPLHPHAVVSDQPSGSWAFLLEWSEPDNSMHRRQTQPQARDFHRRRRRTQGYAFIHYDYPWKGPTGDEVSGFRPDADAPIRRGRAYDLFGFLRCMADEGRQLPPVEMVQRVADFLCARHDADGEQICPPIMDDYELPAMPAIVPSYGLDGDGVDELVSRTLIEPELRNLGQLPLDVWERLLDEHRSRR